MTYSQSAKWLQSGTGVPPVSPQPAPNAAAKADAANADAIPPTPPPSSTTQPSQHP